MSARNIVTRPELLQYGNEYSYDSSIGDIGGFHYYVNGFSAPNPSVTVMPSHTVALTPQNIGQIEVAESVKATSEDVQTMFYTSVDLPNVPKGTAYGWAHEIDCWVYFTAGTDRFATYKSYYV
jgi:hypothetical protein